MKTKNRSPSSACPRRDACAVAAIVLGGLLAAGANASAQPKSVVQFFSNSVAREAYETEQLVSIGIERTGDTNQCVQVRCATEDGTATAGADYLATNVVVEF